jgi:hypothetical protein
MFGGSAATGLADAMAHPDSCPTKRRRHDGASPLLQNLRSRPNTCESSSLQTLPIDSLPIMPYGKTDELAINTIRTLAVRHSPRCLSLPRHAQSTYPAMVVSSQQRGGSVQRVNG